jgi:hypothetical protein
MDAVANNRLELEINKAKFQVLPLYPPKVINTSVEGKKQFLCQAHGWHRQELPVAEGQEVLIKVVLSEHQSICPG